MKRSASSRPPSAKAPRGVTHDSETLAPFRLGSQERYEADAQLRMRHQQTIQQRAEKRLMEECTFRPLINPPIEEEAAGVVHVTRESRREERNPRVAPNSARRATHGSPEPTFRPTINVPVIDLVAERQDDMDHVSRLLHYGQTREENQRARVAEKEAQEKTAHPFRPTILSPTSHDDNRQGAAFFDRVVEKEIQRRVALEERREDAMKPCTFAPSLSKVSATLAMEGPRNSQRRRRHSDVVGRLLSAAEERNAKLRERREFVAAIEEDTSMYRPEINPISRQLAQHGSKAQLTALDFVRRQEAMQEESRAKAKFLEESRARELRAAGRDSDAAGEASHVTHADIEQHVQRLYRRDAAVAAEAKAMLRKAQECRFAPTLSRGTEECLRHIHRDPNVVSRLTAKRRVARPQVEESPPPPPTSGRVVSPSDVRAFYRRQERTLEHREAFLKHQRSVLAMAERAECTFHPKTNAEEFWHARECGDEDDGAWRDGGDLATSRSIREPSLADKAPAGVDAYLERQRKAQRQHEEKVERMRALGKGKPINGPNFTVIVPFSFDKTLEHSHVCAKDDGQHGRTFRRYISATL